MADHRLRVQVARRAAQLMYDREISEYYTAKRKAAAEFGFDGKPSHLPTNAEIREQIRVLADLYEGSQRLENLLAMRIDALRMMRKLALLRPRLIGSTLTGHVRKGSDIDVHVFTDDLHSLTSVLSDEGYDFTVEHKRITKLGESRVFTHVHISGKFKYELTIYPSDKVNYPFKSSITGKTIERANLAELEALLRNENPEIDLDSEVERLEDHADVLMIYRLLLSPLDEVKQGRKHHPEGDVLFHSLQVFELARRERPWDQELLIAALMHDVGKGIDPDDHVGAALEALDGAITDRTAFLIGHHMTAHAYRDGTLGARAKRRLAESDDLEDLMLLQDCDRRGRVPGAVVPTLDQALEYIRSLDEQ